MTVQYCQDVQNAGPIVFFKLLSRWKGSFVKLIYMDFIVFSALYTMIACAYRFGMRDAHKKNFENIVKYVYKYQSSIPVAFILGFYVRQVYKRFWRYFQTVPWVTRIAILVTSYLDDSPSSSKNTGNKAQIQVDKDEARLQRRSVVRYLVASLIITLSRVSVPVKRRFPTIDEICNKGILLEHEAELIKKTEPFSLQPFVPISWTIGIIMDAGNRGRIGNENVVTNIVKEINKFRQLIQDLFLLDQACVPLVYTQVVTLAVYSYFLSCLIGHQYIVDNKGGSMYFVVPFFTIVQFIVYMGWLKLALALVNPMGEDDDDFDLNSLVDYNFNVGMSIVEGIKINKPKLVKDSFYEQTVFELPMESSMKPNRIRPFMGSIYNMKFDDSANKLLQRDSVMNPTLSSMPDSSLMSTVSSSTVKPRFDSSKKTKDSSEKYIHSFKPGDLFSLVVIEEEEDNL